MSDTWWLVRLDGRVRPVVEAIARKEEREPAQVVRRLLDRALSQHPTARAVIETPGARQGTGSGRT